MKPAAKLQELLTAFRKNPGHFGLQDGFVLDELRKQKRKGYEMSKEQAEKVEKLHAQYTQKHVTG